MTLLIKYKLSVENTEKLAMKPLKKPTEERETILEEMSLRKRENLSFSTEEKWWL